MASIRDLMELIENGEYMGGETSPDGDSVQYKLNGRTHTIFLSETFGDAVPSDEDIIRTADAIGTSWMDAEKIEREVA